MTAATLGSNRAMSKSLGAILERRSGALGHLLSLASWHRRLSSRRTGLRPPKDQPPERNGVSGSRLTDLEFLPAALELIETPHSAMCLRLLWIICVAFATVVAWSCFAKLEIYAVAQGKVQPSGRSKIVQPLETGKITAIKVENGTTVAAGQIVLELDPTEVSAERKALDQDLESTTAEIMRRRAAIAWARSETTLTPSVTFPPHIGDDVRQREERMLVADTAQLKASLASLTAQVTERDAQRQRLTMSIGAREELIKILKERVDARQYLDGLGMGYRGRVIDALQEYERERTQIAGEHGQLIENDAAVASLQNKVAELTSNFINEQTRNLLEAERKHDRYAQDLVKAVSRQDRTFLRAPISGTVQQLNVNTIGQVVSPGQPLLTVVPLDGPIEVEALVHNQDIGFVDMGQPAVVKIDAFPFTRYGTIEGAVVKVSRDAVEDRDAVIATDVATASRPIGSASAAEQNGRIRNLVFPVTVQLNQRSIHIDEKSVPLVPGMAVTVEIKTGERRAIDYVLAPVREVASSSGHER
jgi:hemolysin D